MEMVWRSCQVRKAYCLHIFPSPRSQSASAVANGRLMYLISGYTALTTHRALPNMQAIGPHGLNEEEKIIIDGNKEQNYSSRLAAAVTLSSGGVLVTGGKGREREVFLLSGPHLATWQRRADLLHPRMGHAALNLQMDGEEVVMVAGGWDRGGRTLSSVEIFLVGQNVWRDYVPMPSPRADFTLQVRPGHPQSQQSLAGDQRKGDSNRRPLFRRQVLSICRSHHHELSASLDGFGPWVS